MQTVKGRLSMLSGLFVLNLIVIGLVVQYFGVQRASQDLEKQTTAVRGVQAMGLVDMMHDGIRALV